MVYIFWLDYDSKTATPFYPAFADSSATSVRLPLHGSGWVALSSLNGLPRSSRKLLFSRKLLCIIRHRCRAVYRDYRSSYISEVHFTMSSNVKLFWSFLKDLNRSYSMPCSLNMALLRPSTPIRCESFSLITSRLTSPLPPKTSPSLWLLLTPHSSSLSGLFLLTTFIKRSSIWMSPRAVDLMKSLLEYSNSTVLYWWSYYSITCLTSACLLELFPHDW